MSSAVEHHPNAIQHPRDAADEPTEQTDESCKDETSGSIYPQFYARIRPCHGYSHFDLLNSVWRVCHAIRVNSARIQVVEWSLATKVSRDGSLSRVSWQSRKASNLDSLVITQSKALNLTENIPLLQISNLRRTVTAAITADFWDRQVPRCISKVQ